MTWPFPEFPAVPWTKKQIKAYEAKQRQQQPESPL